MKETADRDVLIKIKNGEIEQFSVIVKKYSRMIVLYVTHKLFVKEDVDDIVQEIFIQLYKALPRFDTTKPILPYLFQITKNQLKMYYRSKKMTYPLQESFHSQDNIMEIISIIESEELLNLLNLEQQKALQLLIDGYTYGDIATRMHKPLNTIKTIIRRARLKIIEKNK